MVYSAPPWRQTGGTEDSSVFQDTRAKDTISKLFIGRLKELVKCVNVDYESSRVEEFNSENTTPRKKSPSDLTDPIRP